MVDDKSAVLKKSEVFQESEYLIEEGEVVAHAVHRTVSLSAETLKSITEKFAPLLSQDLRALEFGLLGPRDGSLTPYLIDLVDVTPRAVVAASLLETGVVSQGLFSGRIVHVPQESIVSRSLNMHFHNLQSADVLETDPTVYHAARPDIGLLRLLDQASLGSIAFVFDEGSFLSHFAIVLREKQIPAIINPAAKKMQTGALVRLDAASDGLTLDQRLVEIEDVWVLSYVNPDSDGVVASLALSRLRATVPRGFRPVYFGTLDPETQFILRLCGLAAPMAADKIDDRRMLALVDTHHPPQLPDGINLDNVIEIFDHHPGGSPKQFKNANIHNENVGAVCTLLAEEMRESGVIPAGSLAKAMGLAIVSNTLKFSAPSTSTRDRGAFEWLCYIAPISDAEVAQMFQARTEIGSKDPYETLRANSKKFELAGRSIVLSQIEMDGVEKVFDNELTEQYLIRLKGELGAQFAAVNLVSPTIGKSIVLAADADTRTLLANGVGLDFDGLRAEVPRILLRKTDFIPRLEALLGVKDSDKHF